MLYVDDKTSLSDSEIGKVLYNGKKRTLKTTGNKWSYFQYINFNQVSQPWFVLLSPDEQRLNKPRGNSRGETYVEEMTQFLKCGIAANKSIK